MQTTFAPYHHGHGPPMRIGITLPPHPCQHNTWTQSGQNNIARKWKTTNVFSFFLSSNLSPWIYQLFSWPNVNVPQQLSNTFTTHDKQSLKSIDNLPPNTSMIYSSQLNLSQLLQDADFWNQKKWLKIPNYKLEGVLNFLMHLQLHDAVAANPWPCQTDSVRKSDIVSLSTDPVMRSPSIVPWSK